MSKTTIQISDKLRKKLKKICGSEDKTYEEVIDERVKDKEWSEEDEMW